MDFASFFSDPEKSIPAYALSNKAALKVSRATFCPSLAPRSPFNSTNRSLLFLYSPKRWEHESLLSQLFTCFVKLAARPLLLLVTQADKQNPVKAIVKIVNFNTIEYALLITCAEYIVSNKKIYDTTGQDIYHLILMMGSEMKKYLALLLAGLMLTACASASQPGAMVPALRPQSIVPLHSKLFESVTLGEVKGGKETNPLWASKVSDEDFAKALQQTLRSHAMLAQGKGDYRLDVELIDLDQPSESANFALTSVANKVSVTSDVKYTVTDINSGAVIFERTISRKATATRDDAHLPVKRLQVANEMSIKSNLQSMIIYLIRDIK